MRIAVLLVLLLSGCQPVGDCMAGSSSLAKRLPLNVQIGNRKLSQFTSPWDPWPNPAFEIVQEIRVIVTSDNGYLFVETDPGAANPNDFPGTLWASNWWNESEAREDFSLVDDEFYLNWLPSFAGSSGIIPDTNFTITDWWSGGGGLIPQITIQAFNWGTFLGSQFAQDEQVVQIRLGWFGDRVDEYVALDEAYWIKITHSSVDNTVRVYTAGSACETWVLRHSKVWTRLGVDLPLDRLNMDFVMRPPPATENPTKGYFGPFNPPAVVSRLPLKVEIGDPKVFGLARRLPLKVQVGDP